MDCLTKAEVCRIYGYVRAKEHVIRNVEVSLYRAAEKKKDWTAVEHAKARTNAEGRYEIEFIPEDKATYRVECTAFGINGASEAVEPKKGETHVRNVPVDLSFEITVKGYEQGEAVDFRGVAVGRRFATILESNVNRDTDVKEYRWSALPDATVAQRKDKNEADIIAGRSGALTIKATAVDKTNASVTIEKEEFITEAEVQIVGGSVNVRLDRTATPPTLDEAFWVAIRNRTEAISFGRYREFIDCVMKGGCDFHTPLGNDELDPKLRKSGGAFRHGVAAYELLKVATQVFLLVHCGVKIEEEHRRKHASFESVAGRLDDYLGHSAQLPYIRRVVEASFPWLLRDGLNCDCVLTAAHEPCLIELIREYFLEEGMLMQAMNAITMRFQNVHAPGDRDPLANLEIDPLRPLGNILWGRSMDLNLLSVKRRAYEYMHQYGLALYGKATSSLRPADSRSKFLEAFHNLLYLCSVFFKEDNDTTVIADGYPLLNALKEVHLVLAQGAHNQFGDLPWTARAETLVQQWILAQPEIREFLQSRAMVPYTEAWMPQVDTMKTLQGWSDVTVSHFRDLGAYGERIVLSVRYGDWIAYTNEDHAKHWARHFRADIQAYLHAYRAVTGVDLTNPDTVDATLPAVHLQRRLVMQHGAR